jgi:hypothetical protein
MASPILLAELDAHAHAQAHVNDPLQLTKEAK